ncbi:MAG: metal ABC transporter ATP-binding protein [Myxococcota bacterium]|nr:metal ABC transporter ATP-binding protein [Myxococcota bacterium]
MNETLIRLREVSIGYGRPLMHSVNLELRRGEFWGMVGPNGAGKTTLAKTILGLVPPLIGRVERGVAGLRSSYTPQRHRLNPSYPLCALEVVEMGRVAYLPIGHRPTREDRRKAEEALARLDVSALATKLYRSLSGGQQQRVLLARALAVDPDLLVLDEPAEGMDLLGTSDILGFLKKANQNGRMSVLIQYSNLFEVGPTEAMASSARLTSLYGRPVETHTCAGKTHVHVGES